MLEVLKRLLDSFASLIKDIPAWAKVALAFGIFALLAVVVLANLQQLIVYEVEVLEKNRSGAPRQYLIEHRNTGRESKTDENGRIKLVLQTGFLKPQRNEVVIKKPVLNVGEEAPRVRYGFSSTSWQSQIVPFSVVCDFGRHTCDLEKTGGYQSIEEITVKRDRRWPFGWLVAHAQGVPPASVLVPTLDTLQHVAREGGFTEVRLSNLKLAPSYCQGAGRCPASLYADIEWNGVTLLFDGLEAVSRQDRGLVVAENGAIRSDLVFGLENGLFGRANALRISVYARETTSFSSKQAMQTARRPAQLVDVLEGEVRAGQVEQRHPKSLRGVLSGSLDIRVYPERSGRSFEVRVAAGTEGQVIEKREAVNGRMSLSFAKQPVVAVVRPPLGVNQSWTLVLGVRDQATGRIQTLLSQEEAGRLAADIGGLSEAALGPLNAREFAVSRLPVASSEAAAGRTR